MGFQEIVSLDCDTTISLGGVNKKTGKANPKSVEGFYLGAKTVADAKKKSGVSYIHIFLTDKGNLGVWGKTNMDNKLNGLTPGFLTRVTHTGMQSTPNGDMYVYKVELDKSQSTDLSGLPQTGFSPANEETSYEDEPALDEEEAALDEVPVSRPSLSQRPTAQAPDAARQAKVQALLAGKGVRKTA